ncbi:hypothetical protein [Streptomyces sp. NPDC020965]|uniref:hypothetical protein n=1 Tax=Streptomyces sp. NPDC020965 TaxID=3365105 RepID=UPI0037BCD671
MALPSLDLRAVLAPVRLVWARLERPAARRLVEAAARSELARVVGFAGRTDAPQVLADRVARRLEDQMRLYGPIKDPVGWPIGLALPQRQRCGDVRCDDRMLLDSGQDYPRCEDRQADRRAQRRAVAADVDAMMPGTAEDERRTVTARQLHQEVTAQPRRGSARPSGSSNAPGRAPRLRPVPKPRPRDRPPMSRPVGAPEVTARVRSPRPTRSTSPTSTRSWSWRS